MLVYHPAFDSYHCIQRVICILRTLEKKDHNLDRIRLYDYFLLFPTELGKITLPTSYSYVKKLSKANRYNSVHNSKQTFAQLQGVQEIALKALAALGIIYKDKFEKDIICLVNEEIPSSLKFETDEIINQYLSFTNEYLEELSLRELKERTKLMNYKYELSKSK